MPTGSQQRRLDSRHWGSNTPARTRRRSNSFEDTTKDEQHYSRKPVYRTTAGQRGPLPQPKGFTTHFVSSKARQNKSTPCSQVTRQQQHAQLASEAVTLTQQPSTQGLSSNQRAKTEKAQPLPHNNGNRSATSTRRERRNHYETTTTRQRLPTTHLQQPPRSSIHSYNTTLAPAQPEALRRYSGHNTTVTIQRRLPRRSAEERQRLRRNNHSTSPDFKQKQRGNNSHSTTATTQ